MLEGDIKETGIRSVKGSALNILGSSLSGCWEGAGRWWDVRRAPGEGGASSMSLRGESTPRTVAYSPERGWASKDELSGATGLQQEGEWSVTVGTLMFTLSIWKAVGSIWTRKWTDLIYAFKDHADSGVENRLLGNWSWEAGNGVKVTI